MSDPPRQPHPPLPPDHLADDDVEQHLLSALLVLRMLDEDLHKRRSAYRPRLQDAMGHVAKALGAQRAAKGDGPPRGL